MTHITNNTEQSAYNKEVKQAYYKLLKLTTQLIATVEQHELRCTLQRSNDGPIAPFIVVHELVSPMLLLSLRSYVGEVYTIHFGVEQFEDRCDFSHINSRFVRMLYKLTASENTTVNIENCINTDNIITHCSELYECIEDNNRYHQFVLIKHKPTKAKPKQMKAVA